MNLENHVHANLLVPLECLFDFRLAALTLIDTDFAFEVSSSEQYYTREQDIFRSQKHGSLSRQTLQQVMQKFGPRLLSNSLITKLARFIDRLMINLVKQSFGTPLNAKPALYINTYPYQLSDEEMRDMSACLHALFTDQHEIHYVHLGMIELTPEVVAKHYRAVFFYEPHIWMNMHDKAIRASVLREVTLYAPRLFFVRKFTPDEERVFTEHGVSAYSLLRQSLTPYVNYQDLPVALFCADVPYNLERYAQPEE